MADDRFHAWAALGVDPSKAVQIVRDYDGRVFAMSIDEARLLAARLEKAAEQAETRRRLGSSGAPVIVASESKPCEVCREMEARRARQR